jgi:hypothetical protein
MFQHGQVIIKERMFAMRFEVVIAVVLKLDVFSTFQRSFFPQNMNHLCSSGSKFVPGSELHAQLLVQLHIKDKRSLKRNVKHVKTAGTNIA